MAHQEKPYIFYAIGRPIIEELSVINTHRIAEIPKHKLPNAYHFYKAEQKPFDKTKLFAAKGDMEKYLPTLTNREKRVRREFARGGASRKPAPQMKKW